MGSPDIEIVEWKGGLGEVESISTYIFSPHILDNAIEFRIATSSIAAVPYAS